jgi:hypothetical protein
VEAICVNCIGDWICSVAEEEMIKVELEGGFEVKMEAK